jgi:DNA-binding YbaB/EbfC family protein
VTAEGPDLGGLLSQMQQMQQQLKESVVEGRAGGGAVVVKVTGGMEFQDVVIEPSVVDPNDVEMLQDLVLAAVRDAVARANELNQQALGGLGLGGLGLGEGLDGLLGGSSG